MIQNVSRRSRWHSRGSPYAAGGNKRIAFFFSVYEQLGCKTNIGLGLCIHRPLADLRKAENVHGGHGSPDRQNALCIKLLSDPYTAAHHAECGNNPADKQSLPPKREKENVDKNKYSSDNSDCRKCLFRQEKAARNGQSAVYGNIE